MFSFQKEYMLVEKYANYKTVYKEKIFPICSQFSPPIAWGNYPGQKWFVYQISVFISLSVFAKSRITLPYFTTFLLFWH